MATAIASRAAQLRASRQESLNYLRRTLHPGETVFTTVTRTGRRGVTCWTRLFIIRDGRPEDISEHTARVTSLPYGSRGHAGIAARHGRYVQAGTERLVHRLDLALFPDDTRTLRQEWL